MLQRGEIKKVFECKVGRMKENVYGDGDEVWVRAWR